jgi:hypothetical protein
MFYLGTDPTNLAKASRTATVLVAPCCPTLSVPKDWVLSVCWALILAIFWEDENHATPLRLVVIVRVVPVGLVEVSVRFARYEAQLVRSNKPAMRVICFMV